ncbi:MAG: histidine kinase dimerization/phospho-acceptor domain-containing protein [Bdellovibrionota bacterium]
MNGSSELEKIAHDLRAPLARAKTLLKLLRDARGVESARYGAMLDEALNELDQQICSIVEKANESKIS